MFIGSNLQSQTFFVQFLSVNLVMCSAHIYFNLIIFCITSYTPVLRLLISVLWDKIMNRYNKNKTYKIIRILAFVYGKNYLKRNCKKSKERLSNEQEFIEILYKKWKKINQYGHVKMMSQENILIGTIERRKR